MEGHGDPGARWTWEAENVGGLPSLKEGGGHSSWTLADLGLVKDSSGGQLVKSHYGCQDQNNVTLIRLKFGGFTTFR